MHAPPHTTRPASTSLLVWGGAPGTDDNSTDHDHDAAVFSLSSQTDDDPDHNDHADR